MRLYLSRIFQSGWIMHGNGCPLLSKPFTDVQARRVADVVTIGLESDPENGYPFAG